MASDRRIAPGAAGGAAALVIAGILVAALSLRGPIVSPTPVLRQIETDLGIGAATAGLLTTAPVLMFALLTPVAALVIRRAGAELALMITLTGVLLGTFLRAVPGFGWMLAGMIVIGASITVGNVVIPVIIRRDVAPERVALVTAAYVAMLNAGSLLTSLLTVPIASVIGWNLALLAWSVITIAGMLLWGLHLRHAAARGDLWGERFSGAPRAGAASVGDRNADALTGPVPVPLGRGRMRGDSMFRHPVPWMLLLAFAGQAAVYYGFATWLPTLIADDLGVSAAAAGGLTAFFHGVAVVGAFVVPLLARFTPRIVPAVAICVSWVVLTVGMLVAPEWAAVWLSFGAIGHAGGFVVIFSTLVAIARSDAEAAGMSALVQGGGYGAAALAAPAMGALHEATGGWEAVLLASLVVVLIYCVLLLAAVIVSWRAPR